MEYHESGPPFFSVYSRIYRVLQWIFKCDPVAFPESVGYNQDIILFFSRVISKWNSQLQYHPLVDAEHRTQGGALS